MKHFLSLLTFISAVLTSCSQLPYSDDGSGDPNTQTNETNVIIIDEETIENNCSFVSEDKIIFTDLDKSQIPAIGDIINGGASTSNPYGFLGKVTSVEDSDEGISISYEIVPINEAVEELDIDEEYDLEIESITYYDADGNEEEITEEDLRAEISTSISISKSYSFTEDNQTTKFSISFIGSVKAELEYEIEDFKTKEFSFTVTPSAEFIAALENNIEVKYSKDITIAKIKYKSIIITSPIFIVLTPTTNVSLSFESVSKIYHKSTLNCKLSAPIGFEYSKGVGKDIFNPQATGGLTFEGGISGSVGVGLKFDTSIYPYIFDSICIGTEIFLPQFELSTNVSTTTTVNSTSANTEISLDANISAKSYAKAEIFDFKYETEETLKITHNLYSMNALPVIDNVEVSTYGSVQASYDLKTAPIFGITQHGFCWSDSPNPTINDNYNKFGSLSLLSIAQNFSYTLPTLNSNTTYYVRPYFTGWIDTYYGEEKTVTTSLTEMSIDVGDNGNLADDSYEVYLNDHYIGTTTIGAINKIGIDNLESGWAILKVKCIVAPDNVGTLGVSLNNGITLYESSMTSFTATLSLNESKQWIIDIPTTATSSQVSVPRSLDE